MKAHGKMEIKLHAFLTSALDGSCMISFTNATLKREQGRPLSRCGHFRRSNSHIKFVTIIDSRCTVCMHMENLDWNKKYSSLSETLFVAGKSKPDKRQKNGWLLEDSKTSVSFRCVDGWDFRRRKDLGAFTFKGRQFNASWAARHL